MLWKRWTPWKIDGHFWYVRFLGFFYLLQEISPNAWTNQGALPSPGAAAAPPNQRIHLGPKQTKRTTVDGSEIQTYNQLRLVDLVVYPIIWTIDWLNPPPHKRRNASKTTPGKKEKENNPRVEGCSTFLFGNVPYSGATVDGRNPAPPGMVRNL